MTANLTARERGAVTIIDVSGKVTLGETSIAFRAKMWELVDTGGKWSLLSMAGGTCVDSAGMGELVAGYTAVTSAGGEMKLLNVSERVKDLLQITRLCAVFEMHEDEATAIRSFSAPP